MLKEGLSYTSAVEVKHENLAVTLESGDMEVFATPALVALMENAAMLCVAPELPEGSSTVGGMIQTSHVKPSAPGATIEATATLTQVDGRKLLFKVEAYENGVLVGEGTHLRFIVDRAKFLSKLK
jgi:predicted thioesterase